MHESQQAKRHLQDSMCPAVSLLNSFCCKGPACSLSQWQLRYSLASAVLQIMQFSFIPSCSMLSRQVTICEAGVRTCVKSLFCVLVSGMCMAYVFSQASDELSATSIRETYCTLEGKQAGLEGCMLLNDWSAQSVAEYQ